MRGLLVLEGLDGSGKSTQFDCLLERLRLEGYTSKGISFPDYKEESSALVRMYLDGEFGSEADSVNAYAASSFYAVDRYASFKKHWQAGLRGGNADGRGPVRDFQRHLPDGEASNGTGKTIFPGSLIMNTTAGLPGRTAWCFWTCLQRFPRICF